MRPRVASLPNLPSPAARTILSSSAEQHLCNSPCASLAFIRRSPDIKIEVIDAGEWNTAADGYGIGAQIAERPADERPDFVVGLTDVLASGVVSALVDKGISVPGQVRVAGCDGNPLAWSGSVPLTTVAPPGYEIGRKGVQLLMEQIENKAPAKTKHIRVGSAARTVTAVTAAEDINRQELVRPFLLERASTQASSQTDATAINLGAYL